ncbi:hypothetical protein PM082_007475 [Marasmius tenuissimus]|nr:hypothetical protein PM082_007475 [Marasmius tenuissimus]
MSLEPEGQALVLWDFEAGANSLGHPVNQILRDCNSRINQRPRTILALNHETYGTRRTPLTELADPTLLPPHATPGFTAYQVLPCVVQKLKAAIKWLRLVLPTVIGTVECILIRTCADDLIYSYRDFLGLRATVLGGLLL